TGRGGTRAGGDAGDFAGGVPAPFEKLPLPRLRSLRRRGGDGGRFSGGGRRRRFKVQPPPGGSARREHREQSDRGGDGGRFHAGPAADFRENGESAGRTDGHTGRRVWGGRGGSWQRKQIEPF